MLRSAQTVGILTCIGTTALTLQPPGAVGNRLGRLAFKDSACPVRAYQWTGWFLAPSELSTLPGATHPRLTLPSKREFDSLAILTRSLGKLLRFTKLSFDGTLSSKLVGPPRTSGHPQLPLRADKTTAHQDPLPDRLDAVQDAGAASAE